MSSSSSAQPAVEKRLELRPDRQLLDPNFEGYKLSLDSPPVFSSGLSEAAAACSVGGVSPRVPVSSRTPSDDQYSFLHVKLFSGSANPLFADPDDPERVFFVEPHSARIWRVVVPDGSGNKTPQLCLIWDPPAAVADSFPTGSYNPSLAFAGGSHAVLADGRGLLHVLETGDRSSLAQWISTFSEEISGKERPFIVASAVAVEEDGQQGEESDGKVEIHCLVNYVEDKDKVEGLDKKTKERNKEEGGAPNFVNVVEWMTLARSGSCWGLERLRRFAFFGSLDYLQLDASAEVFYASTEKPFFKVYDSAGADDDVEGVDGGVGGQDDGHPPFFWFQGVEDMVVWVVLPEDCRSKRQVKVTLKPRKLEVVLKGEAAVSGELWGVLEGDSMTWTIQGDKLEINICKASEGLVWQRFLKEGEDGEEVSDPAHIDEAVAHGGKKVKEQQQQDEREVRQGQGDQSSGSAYNAQELEECDALPDDASALLAVGGDGRVTHRADLAGHQFLFQLRAVEGGGQPASLCLRHDVDGLVWQPQRGREASDVKYVHVGTFSALGYVQASKEQRRWTVASPSMSYSAVVEASRRAYLYCQPTPIASEFDLRNRKSGRKVSQVAKQQVVTLEGSEQIQGVAATDAALILLTSDNLHVLRMN